MYKLSDIRNLCLNEQYRMTPWRYITGFFTGRAGGCIGFNYGTFNMPVRIGYGLTVEEATSLLDVVCEKGWIADFQLSDDTLEYKKNESVRKFMMIPLSMASLGIILMFALEQPYKKITFVSMIIFALFCFVMAFISYRKQRNIANMKKTKVNN